MTLFRRFLLVAIATLVSSEAEAQKKQQPDKVVFVCEHGTVKSVVALEYFNRLARERGLNIQAISRGTRPDSTVPGPVNVGLTGDGFDVSHFRARALTRDDLSSALMVVSLDADVNPIVGNRVPVFRWDSLPSVMSNYANGRAAIVRRVEHLVDSLAKVAPKRR